VATVRAAATYDPDDRGIIGLMMLPFLVIALSLGLSQTVKPFIASLPATVITVRLPAPISAPVPAPVVVAKPTPDPSVQAAQRLAAWTPPALPWRLDVTPPRIDLPVLAPSARPVVIPLPTVNLPLTAPVVVPVSTNPGIRMPLPLPLPLPLPDAPQVCARPAPRVLPTMGRSTVPAALLGPAIAAAALDQTRDFVVYSAKYRRLSYPLGDMASFYGACSDVIIRAYRTIGLDLQELVQRTRVGNGDASIDHRRTETLRKFFTLYGDSLTPTAYPEDYQPGDIVTYYRPFSRVSRAHIAVVSDVRAPTGRMMIVHNRGWGAQLEDALFVDRITGHYRFDGSKLVGVPRPAVPSVANRPRSPGQLSRASWVLPTSASMIVQP
jgi:uncharacterized protein